jgi:RNA polymerase sigma-70 factor (ECF subfamily)
VSASIETALAEPGVDVESDMVFPSTKKHSLDAAFDTVMGSYGAALRRVAATYEADPDLREDLFQEIGLAIWRALPAFRGDASMRTFVFRIAHNRGLSHGWREGRRPEFLEEPEFLIDEAPSPEIEAAQSQRRRRLLEAIHQLPIGMRQVITLRLEGLSHREIADVTGLTENNVMVRASRARGRLKKILTPPKEGNDE